MEVGGNTHVVLADEQFAHRDGLVPDAALPAVQGVVELVDEHAERAERAKLLEVLLVLRSEVADRGVPRFEQAPRRVLEPEPRRAVFHHVGIVGL